MLKRFGRYAKLKFLILLFMTMTINSTIASASKWQNVSDLTSTHVASADELKSLHAQFARKNIASYIEDATEVRIHPGDLTLTG